VAGSALKPRSFTNNYYANFNSPFVAYLTLAVPIPSTSEYGPNIALFLNTISGVQTRWLTVFLALIAHSYTSHTLKAEGHLV